MIKKSIKIIAFISLVVCLTLRINNVLSKIDIWLVEDFYKNKDELDVVLIGGSNLYAFYNPMIAWNDYHIKTYDLANSCQPFEITMFMLDEARKQQPNAKYVICLDNIERDIDEKTIHYALDEMPPSNNKYKIAERLIKMGGFSREDAIQFYVPIWVYHSSWTEIKKNNYVPQFQYQGADISDEYLKVSIDVSDGWKETDELEEMYPMLETSLGELMNYCDENDVPITFVIMPRAVSNERILGEYNTMTKVIEGRGYEVIDLRKNKDSVGIDLSTDYYQVGHVNINGSKKVTDYISEELVRKYNLQSQKDRAWDCRYEKYIEKCREVMAPQ